MRSISPSTALVLCLLGVGLSAVVGLRWHSGGSGASEPDGIQPEERALGDTPASRIDMDRKPHAIEERRRQVLLPEITVTANEGPDQDAGVQAASAIELTGLSGEDIGRLSDSELESVPLKELSKHAVQRYSGSQPIKFWAATKSYDEDFDLVLGTLVREHNVPRESVLQAEQELTQLRIKIQEIWSSERKSSQFIESVPFNAPEAQQKRSMASWCLHTARIENRALPFMRESEAIILGLFELQDPEIKLPW